MIRVEHVRVTIPAREAIVAAGGSVRADSRDPMGHQTYSVMLPESVPGMVLCHVRPGPDGIRMTDEPGYPGEQSCPRCGYPGKDTQRARAGRVNRAMI